LHVCNKPLWCGTETANPLANGFDWFKCTGGYFTLWKHVWCHQECQESVQRKQNKLRKQRLQNVLKCFIFRRLSSIVQTAVNCL
jgi:hypothetical protein